MSNPTVSMSKTSANMRNTSVNVSKTSVNMRNTSVAEIIYPEDNNIKKTTVLSRLLRET